MVTLAISSLELLALMTLDKPDDMFSKVKREAAQRKLSQHRALTSW